MSAHDDVWGDPIAGEGNTCTDPYVAEPGPTDQAEAQQ